MENNAKMFAEIGAGSSNEIQLVAASARINDLEEQNAALAAQVEALRDALAELRDVAQRCDSWESFPQNALDAAAAALHETPHCAEIKIPTGAEAAAGMALIGMSWLENNAPEKLTELHREIRAQAGRDGYLQGHLDAAGDDVGEWSRKHSEYHAKQYADSIRRGEVK